MKKQMQVLESPEAVRNAKMPFLKKQQKALRTLRKGEVN